MERYDAVVVGAGAAGGWAAKELCERGLTVCLIDAGPVVGAAPVARGPHFLAKGTALLGGQHVQARSGAFRAETRHLFVDDRENPYTTEPGMPFNWFRGRQVGGRLHLWMRVTPRMTDRELHDWPFDAQELAPYYDRVETFLGVTRAKLTPEEARLRDAVEARWPDRLVEGAASAAREPGPVPRTIEAARSTGLLTLRSDTVVRRVEVDGDGLATGVSVVGRVTGQEETLRADTVVLAASTIETVRLMLNSASPAHPDGLGNSSGLLGTGIADHALVAIGGPHPSSAPAERRVGFQIAGLGHGFGVQGEIGREDWWTMAAIGPMLPRPENRVTLSPGARDAWGVPAAHIRCAFSKDETALAADQLAVLHELAAAAELRIERGRSLPQRLALRLARRTLHSRDGLLVPGGAVHETGGAALGVVLDPFGGCLDAPNVFVVDGAAFPSSGWQNVTLTIMALAARAGERIAARR